MADTTIFDQTAPSAGSVALAHEKLLRQKVGGVYRNITGDINNLNLNPTPVTVVREVYGTKGANSTNVLSFNYGPTFNVEVVRDPVTKRIVAAQDWFLDLYAAAFSKGEDNKREFQIITDALDERMPTFQGKFSVAVTEANSGFADKSVFTFTLSNDGDVPQIPSPIAGDGTPEIEIVEPAGQGEGEQVAIRGYAFGDATAVTFGTETAEFTAVDSYTIVAVIPEAAGNAVKVTNSKGDSSAFTYSVA